MNTGTLRNLMASMLVLGVAGSVIAMGSGTFAVFNATTTNPSNTFSTDDLILNNTANGSLCTSQASVNSGATPLTADTPSRTPCVALAQLTNMIPGDSKLGRFQIKNTSAKAAFSLALTVTDANASQTLSTKAPSDAASGGGLGLFLFTCRTTLNAPTDCNPSGAGAVAKVIPIYATTTASGCTVGTAISLTSAAGQTASKFDSTHVTVTQSQIDDTITIDGTKCKPGNDATAISLIANAAITGPDVIVTSNPTPNTQVPNVFDSSVNPTTNPVTTAANFGLDYLTGIVNLPVTAKNTFAGGAATSNAVNLSMAWTATQIVGQP